MKIYYYNKSGVLYSYRVTKICKNRIYYRAAFLPIVLINNSHAVGTWSLRKLSKFELNKVLNKIRKS